MTASSWKSMAIAIPSMPLLQRRRAGLSNPASPPRQTLFLRFEIHVIRSTPATTEPEVTDDDDHDGRRHADLLLRTGVTASPWGGPHETTRRQLAPSLSQGELDVGSGSCIQPRDDRRGMGRFDIQNASTGGHHEPNQCYTTRQRAGR